MFESLKLPTSSLVCSCFAILITSNVYAYLKFSPCLSYSDSIKLLSKLLLLYPATTQFSGIKFLITSNTSSSHGLSARKSSVYPVILTISSLNISSGFIYTVTLLLSFRTTGSDTEAGLQISNFTAENSMILHSCGSSPVVSRS